MTNIFGLYDPWLVRFMFNYIHNYFDQVDFWLLRTLVSKILWFQDTKICDCEDLWILRSLISKMYDYVKLVWSLITKITDDLRSFDSYSNP